MLLNSDPSSCCKWFAIRQAKEEEKKLFEHAEGNSSQSYLSPSSKCIICIFCNKAACSRMCRDDESDNDDDDDDDNHGKQYYEIYVAKEYQHIPLSVFTLYSVC